MPGIASGDLRHKVELQERRVTQNPVTGEMITQWATIARPWAQVVPASVREFVAASAEQSEVRGRMVLRYRGHIDASMRIVHRGKWYGILGVMEDAESGREHLTLATAEGVRLDQ